LVSLIRESKDGVMETQEALWEGKDPTLKEAREMLRNARLSGY